jgi:hypothetical protein
MSDIMTDEVRAIIAKFSAGEILSDDEINKLPDEIEIEEAESLGVEAGDGAPASNWDAAKVAETNNQNMKSASDVDVLTVLFADEWILIGEHNPATLEAFSAVLHPAGIATGTATVTPPKGAFNPGTITFTGLGQNTQEITACLKGFSKRKVTFE